MKKNKAPSNSKLLLKKSINIFYEKIIYNNPVLTGISGIFIVAFLCTTIVAASAISLIVFLVSFVLNIIIYFTCRHISKWLRTPLYIILSTALIIPATLLSESLLQYSSEMLYVFVPLLCVNGILFVRIDDYVTSRSLLFSMLECIAWNIGFFLCAFITGGLRQLISLITLPGGTAESPLKLSAFSLVFGGFLIISLLGATISHSITYIKQHFRNNGEEI
jgi:Na+-translocating ferredoxin:NAD+ oxidoreductase subunit E